MRVCACAVVQLWATQCVHSVCLPARMMECNRRTLAHKHAHTTVVVDEKIPIGAMVCVRMSAPRVYVRMFIFRSINVLSVLSERTRCVVASFGWVVIRAWNILVHKTHNTHSFQFERCRVRYEYIYEMFVYSHSHRLLCVGAHHKCSHSICWMWSHIASECIHAYGTILVFSM